MLQGLRVIVNIASVAGVEPMKSACACEPCVYLALQGVTDHSCSNWY